MSKLILNILLLTIFKQNPVGFNVVNPVEAVASAGILVNISTEGIGAEPAVAF